jgi:hypothetical protein
MLLVWEISSSILGQDKKEAGISDSVAGLYSGSAGFISRLGHWSSSVTFLAVLLTFFRQIHDLFFPNKFQFFILQPSYNFTLYSPGTETQTVQTERFFGFPQFLQTNGRTHFEHSTAFSIPVLPYPWKAIVHSYHLTLILVADAVDTESLHNLQSQTVNSHVT